MNTGGMRQWYCTYRDGNIFTQRLPLHKDSQAPPQESQFYRSSNGLLQFSLGLQMGHLLTEFVEPPNLSLWSAATVDERREGAADVGAIKASFHHQTKQQNKREIFEEIPSESEKKRKSAGFNFIWFFCARGKRNVNIHLIILGRSQANQRHQHIKTPIKTWTRARHGTLKHRNDSSKYRLRGKNATKMGFDRWTTKRGARDHFPVFHTRWVPQFWYYGRGWNRFRSQLVGNSLSFPRNSLCHSLDILFIILSFSFPHQLFLVEASPGNVRTKCEPRAILFQPSGKDLDDVNL